MGRFPDRVTWVIAVHCVLALFGPLLAQSPPLPPFDLITDRQGLPQAFVSAIVQDRQGFIWAATRDGLCRYDGQRFRVFQPRPDRQPSLSFAGVHNLTLDHHGRIWITSERGDLDIFDPLTEVFVNFSRQPAYQRAIGSQKVFSYCVDHRDRLWLIPSDQRELLRFDLKSGRINRFYHQTSGPRLASSSVIMDVTEGADGQIWLATGQGLEGFDEKTGRFRHYPLPSRTAGTPVAGAPVAGASSARTSLAAYRLYARPAANDGEILVFYQEEVIRFQPRNGAVRSYSLRFALPEWNNSNFATDSQGRVYFNNGGTLCSFTTQGGVQLLARRSDRPKEGGNRLWVDRSGVLWEGTGGAGIRRYDLRARPFRTTLYQHSFHVDLLGERWLAVPRSKWASITPISRTSYNFRYTLDGRGRLWYNNGTSVLGRVDLKTGQFEQYALPGPFANREYGDPPCALATDPQGQVWAVRDSLVWHYEERQAQWLTSPYRIPVRQTGTVLVCTVDAHAFWLATEQRGLWRLDRKTGRVRQYANRPGDGRSLSNDALFSIADDPDNPNRLWIGTFGSGLCAFDKQTGTCRRFTQPDGLPNNVIYSVIPDRQGYLWMGTNKGICRMHRQTFATQIYTRDDGLLADEFNRFHALHLPDDRIIMGGLEGITAFYPRQVSQPDPYEPSVELTSLLVNNQPVGLASATGQRKNAVSVQPVQALHNLELAHDQNYLTAEFAVLQFNRPAKNRYRYRLDGLDAQWTSTDRPVAVYTALPPGQYTLWLNASNTSGRWSRHVRKLILRIKPPFWATWWAYGLYALVTAGVGWVLVRTYRNRLRLRQSMALQRRELRWRQQEADQLKSVDELKTRFFANITHEFRTPLTLILGPAGQMIAESRSPVDARRLDTIDRNAHRLLDLVNQLLDLAKLEAGHLPVEAVRGDLAAFVGQTVQDFQSQAETTGIQLRFRPENLATEYWFDPPKLGQIVANLLANAMKFSSRDNQVTVALASAGPDAVQLAVIDTGAGIDAGKLPHIFDRFYQADDSPTRQHEGTGIGLALVKELVELQRGRIDVMSEVGRGTTFTVWLPYRRVIAAPGEPAELTGLTLPTTAVPATQPATEPVGLTAESPMVLIVEDNDELAHLIADSLPATYQIHRSADGQAGLDAAFAHQPDLVISDVLMPRLDGYALVDRLKNDLRTSHIPVMLLTARTALSSRVEGLALGADDYLTKPFYPAELQLRVRNLLARQNRLRAWLRAQLTDPAPAPTPDTESTNPFLDQLYQAIEQHLDDSAFGVEELAARSGLSRSQLYRKIKTLTDLSATDLIRTYRLKRAAQWLQRGQSVSEVAYRVGFETPSYFGKCFRELYGVPPSEYAQPLR